MFPLILFQTAPAFDWNLYAIVALVITTIVAPILTYRYTKQPTDVISIGKTDAETDKIKTETVSQLIATVVDITQKFRVASDEYLAAKIKIADIQNDLEEVTEKLDNLTKSNLERETAVRDFLNTIEEECPNPMILSKVAAIKSRFFPTVSVR